MFLRAYQIYYEPSQLSRVEYIPVNNSNCTPFFENTVISDLIKRDLHIGCEYFAVVSWKIKNKIGNEMKNQWRNMPNISNLSLNEFTPEQFAIELERHRPDVMSFQRHAPHDPISFADRFHPNFSKYFKEIMWKIGFDWKPETFQNVFYCNYQAAKSDIYESYVKNMLNPAMAVMGEMPELMQNSGYPTPLPEHLKKSFGVNHYPYHAFLCERMFSYFVHLNQYKVMHY